MFNEFACGCIVSPEQGRVRICSVHRPQAATGDGAVETVARFPGIVRQYPGNGRMPVGGWRGR